MKTIDSELQTYINEEIEKKLNEILNPVVEIVSLDNPIPTYATPGDAGADIMASLNRVQTKFLKDAYLKTNMDELHEQLQEAFDKDDHYGVEQLWGLIDETSKEPEYTTALVIKPGGHCLVPTGIFTSFPDNYVADIIPRSGNSLKFRITITNSPGKIDARYKNEWGIIIDNEGDTDFVIRPGDKIAQVQFSLKCQAHFVQKSNVEDLSGTDRGGGFGHTGK